MNIVPFDFESDFYISILSLVNSLLRLTMGLIEIILFPIQSTKMKIIVLIYE